MTETKWQRVLEELYGERADEVAPAVAELLEVYRRSDAPSAALSAGDAWLITYADQFQDGERPPLVVLAEFLDQVARPWITGVHVLPFYPWSSDDGFSVKDYLSVDPDYGTWDDIEALAVNRRLMADAVINHMSAESQWFQRFLAGDPEFAGFFRTADADADLSATVRPRTTPLLTHFDGTAGDQWVWTTFSADQVDLDYRNPAVLLRVLEVLLAYVRHGASVIRLDAIAFLWKEEGTTSLHLPQTHAAVHFLRLCLDEAAPGTVVVTETNVPHAENISYFGTDERPEAQLVYQFPLAPLVLDALVEGDATALVHWAESLGEPMPGRSFLNFLASHDGVGVRPAEGLIPRERVLGLAELSRRAGGGVGERNMPDGSVVPYELNSTWFDLLAVGHTEEEAIARHLASHAVMFALAGVPLIYVHSLFGSSNDQAGFERTGRPRSFNREKFTDLAAIYERLGDPGTRAGRIWSGIRSMLELRAGLASFDPWAPQRLLDAPPEVMAIERSSGTERILVYVNTSPNAVGCRLPEGEWAPLLGPLPAAGAVELPAWSYAWLKES